MRLLPTALLLTSLLAQAQQPIIFVHGNGDDSAKWMPVIWLFESNGYPRHLLRAISFPHPAARANDSRPEPNRSSTTDQAAELASFVARTMLETGAGKVMLVGSSRGGLTIRNYLKFAGGAAVASHAVLCGTPNHGVFARDTALENEFNGQGTFVQGLNAGGETAPGVSMLTLRSDRFDKYAQPAGTGYDSPALEGATNLVLPGLDHREVAFHREAFRAMYVFLTSKEPGTLEPAAEKEVILSGLVTGFMNNAPTNLPEAGVRLRIYPLGKDGARTGPPLQECLTTETGSWGPVSAASDAFLEFELQKGNKVVRYFRSPFPRSSTLVNLRWRLEAAPGLVIERPQGYFSKERDQLTVNKKIPAALPAGLPAADSFRITQTAGPALIELRGEVIAARAPDSPSDTHIAELRWD